MRITSIQKSKQNRKMLCVYVEDKYSFSIDHETYIKLNLYDDKEITEDDIINIKHNINVSKAKSCSINYIHYKLRSEHEVRNKLKKEGFDKETVDIVIEELISMGYINDRMYVQKFIYDRTKLKPKSVKMIKSELLHKGIKSSIIEEAILEWNPDEEYIAETITRKKFGKYDLNDELVLKKVFYFLKHRGFGYDTIRSVIIKLNNEK